MSAPHSTVYLEVHTETGQQQSWGEIFGSSEIIGRMFVLREYYGYFAHLSPGLVGFEDCESLFTHLK